MQTPPPPAPRHYLGVTLSSTFEDLKDHRAALIKAVTDHGLHPVAMEADPAKHRDVIDSSLQMVRDGAAYIGILSKRYGQIPACPHRNPDNLSITELEFNEALRLGRPIVLFVMGRDHLVHEDHIERNPAKRRKLKAFTARAKQGGAASAVQRVYATFDSLDQFKERIGPAIAELRRTVEQQGKGDDRPAAPPPRPTDIPRPPNFYAAPSYIGSLSFVGRDSQLQELSKWAAPDDPTNLLLFEAIGGNGKSMLTWEWTTKHATRVRPDWAGRFWYSFYERGAVMADFCQRALAYMTGATLEELQKKKTAELRESLLSQLQSRPWLLVLDGLERVLVAYHRIDAAEVPDEEANRPTDKIVDRNPCNAIRDEDNDLLRALAAAAPSKILVSSRLTPRVLLSAAGLPIVGARRINLPGLRPADAEQLLRSCGVSGDSAAIQDYLAANCDNHPLVIGVLAGLVNNYLPDRGNFGAWSADPAGGGQLDLAALDLTQRRNHILRAALSALPETSAQLLSTLALLPESVDFDMLAAFNPHLPPEPEPVAPPRPLERLPETDEASRLRNRERQQQHEAALTAWRAHEAALQARAASDAFRQAPARLRLTVLDLEHRGLLHYEQRTKRYDLHPVVRGVAAGGLAADKREQYGMRAVDYFSRQPHNPYADAKSLEDVRSGVNVVRTLLQLGHLEQAFWAYDGDLASALLYNLEANCEIVALLRPFFKNGWATLPEQLSGSNAAIVANHSGIALQRMGEYEHALQAHSAALAHVLKRQDWGNVGEGLFAISETLSSQNRLAQQDRCLQLAMALAEAVGRDEPLFLARLNRMVQLTNQGLWDEAEAVWRRLDPMERSPIRIHYLPGEAEYRFARLQFWRGAYSEEAVATAGRLAHHGNSRSIIRALYHLRGERHLEQDEWQPAAENLHEALRMARESKITDADAETGLALAKFHLGQLPAPAAEAERLGLLRQPARRLLARLWLALGDRTRAAQHGLAAYTHAWADGEPYVSRYELTRSADLLRSLGLALPVLPRYDAARDPKLPWEEPLAAAIQNVSARRKKREAELHTAQEADRRLRALPAGTISEAMDGVEIGQMNCTRVRQIALDLYVRGDLRKTHVLLSLLLQVGFEEPSTRCHLARLALLTGQEHEAHEHVARAWALRTEAPPAIVPRMLWLRLALAAMETGGAPNALADVILGQLKSALRLDQAFMAWSMDPILTHLRATLNPDWHRLLAALVAALSDPAKVPELEVFPVWRDAIPRPLDTPWPT